MGAMNELHNCFHEHITETRERFDDIKTDIRGIDVRVARVEGAADGTNRALGVHVDGENNVKIKKPIFLMSIPKALWYVGGAAAAGAGGYKILWAAALAIHTAILGAAQ